MPCAIFRVRAAEVIADVETPQEHRWRLLKVLYAVFRRRHGGSSLLTSRVAIARGRLDLLQSEPLRPSGEGLGWGRMWHSPSDCCQQILVGVLRIFVQGQ